MPSAQRDLAGELQQATSALHRQVERSEFVGRLISGRLDGPGYLRWLRCLEAIYGALEDGFEQHASHPLLAAISALPLGRSTALQHDITYWQTLVSSALPLPVAATTYQSHLRSLVADDPAMLLSHAYVRYLGDLSGGQLLHRAVARMQPSDGGRGCAFYDFGTPADVVALAARFRDALRAAGITASASGDFDRLIDEAMSAFQRHGELFAELATAPTPG